MESSDGIMKNPLQDQLDALEAGILDLYGYLQSEKFRTDTTVQVSDVMHRLDSIRHDAGQAFMDAVNHNGSLPVIKYRKTGQEYRFWNENSKTVVSWCFWKEPDGTFKDFYVGLDGSPVYKNIAAIKALLYERELKA